MAESADRVAIAFDPAQIRKAQDRNPFVKISDIVYDILSEAILSSTIAPGSKLNISSIAENLNISHTPVFQAVDRLKNSGLIVESNETSKYHSYRVLDISNESLTNLFTARKAIETTAASICATNVALIDIAQLKKMAAEFRTVWSLYANGRGTSADFADRETLDRAFHIVSYEFTCRMFAESFVGKKSLPSCSDRDELIPVDDRTAAPYIQMIYQRLLRRRGMRKPKEKLSSDVQAVYVQNVFRNILMELGSVSNDLLDIFTKIASSTFDDKERINIMIGCFVSNVFGNFDDTSLTEKS